MLLEWLEEARLDRVGCFTYSPVAGAAANELPDHVPAAVAAERHARFMETAARISAEKLAAKKGLPDAGAGGRRRRARRRRARARAMRRRSTAS